MLGDVAGQGDLENPSLEVRPDTLIKNKQKIEQIAGLALIIAIIACCGYVLRPFVLPILWAAILCFATWPIYELLLKWLRGRKTLASGLMVIILLLVLFIPFFLIGLQISDSIYYAVEWLKSHGEASLPAPPEWVKRIPVIGTAFDEYWTRLVANSGTTMSWLKPHLQGAGVWLLQHSLGVASGIFELAISVLIAFFLYRDGVVVVERLREGFQQISGDYAQHLMDVVKATVRSVVYGIIGTALAQATVAGIGFAIAGVPSPILLAMLTFFLSFLPAGPVLVWLGTAAWLFASGQTGWGIFMIAYGTLVISTIDNFIKPYIISRGSKLSFIVTFIGVIGGIMTFGFIGVFLGPTLLAVGYSLANEILIQPRSRASQKPAAASNTIATPKDNPSD